MIQLRVQGLQNLKNHLIHSTIKCMRCFYLVEMFSPESSFLHCIFTSHCLPFLKNIF